jgi:hypothetical protein
MMFAAPSVTIPVNPGDYPPYIVATGMSAFREQFPWSWVARLGVTALPDRVQQRRKMRGSI